MHLSSICLLRNENLKLVKKRNTVFGSLPCLKNDKNIILTLPISQTLVKKTSTANSI